MKKLLILTIVSALATQLSAQDLIVTSFGDTIPCQIIRMDSISVAYQTVKKNGTKEASVLLRQFVTDFRVGQENASTPVEIEDTVSRPEIANVTVVTGSKPVAITQPRITGSKPEYTTIRLGFAPGYAKRLNKITGKGAYSDLFKKLTNGFSWDADVQVYINKRNGIGLDVSGVHSSAFVNDRITIRNSNYIDLKVKQRMFYIGPAWTKLYETNHFIFTGNLSLGALFYTEKYDPYGTGTFEDKHSVAGGMNFGIGVETKISSVCAIGLKTGTMLDSFSLFNIGDQSFKALVPVSWSSFRLAAYISFRS